MLLNSKPIIDNRSL